MRAKELIDEYVNSMSERYPPTISGRNRYDDEVEFVQKYSRYFPSKVDRIFGNSEGVQITFRDMVDKSEIQAILNKFARGTDLYPWEVDDGQDEFSVSAYVVK